MLARTASVAARARFSSEETAQIERSHEEQEADHQNEAEEIESVARALLDDSSLSMATLKKRIMDKNELSDPNTVKVVTDRTGLALYFSRACIPNIALGKPVDLKETAIFKHIGLYAYTKDFLFTFKNLPVSNLEIIERLEQLRVLEAGYKIKVMETNLETIGVDTPEDLEKVKKKLSK